MKSMYAPVLIALITLAPACPDGGKRPQGLKRTPSGNGPVIVFDPIADPVPDIPFPNDLATVHDTYAATGRRVNVRMAAPTGLEEIIRLNINTLNGFGTFSPITVRFTEELDLRTVRNDTILVINLNAESENYGEAVPLDLGRGNFPLSLEGRPTLKEAPAPEIDFSYFKFDYRWMATNLMLETEEEDAPVSEQEACDPDRHCNGVLDPGEDSDFDGILDHPNVVDPERFNRCCETYEGSPFDPDDPHDGLITFYEFETNTLIGKPIVPLEQETEYAIVITKGVRGQDMEPVRSPFPYVNHTTQTEDLRPLEDLLPRYGYTLDDIAFAWTFTTQSITRDLEAIRRGLDGEGPFTWLSATFPPKIDHILDHEVCVIGDFESHPPFVNTHVIKIERLKEVFLIMAYFTLGNFTGFSDFVPMISKMLGDYERYADYLIIGSYRSPYFVTGEEEIFHMDWQTGEAMVDTDDVTFWAVVPRRRADRLTRDPEDVIPSWYPRDDEPFPVVLYNHGYSGSKFEALGFAGSLARFGFTTVGIDAAGHGPQNELASLADVLDQVPPEPPPGEPPYEGFDDWLMSIIPRPIYKLLLRQLLAPILVKYSPDYDDPKDVIDLCGDSAKCVIVEFENTPLFGQGFQAGRAVDHTGDGITDSGADFWSGESFHTRDMVRQSIVDHMQFARILETFDGRSQWEYDLNGDGVKELAGDFNCDGVVDFGGPGGLLCTMGQSMGGFFAAVEIAVDPRFAASAPSSAGAGLFDVGLRTTQEGAVEAVFLELLGPMVVGGPKEQLCEQTGVTVLCDEDQFHSDGYYVAFDRLKGNYETLDRIDVISPPNLGDVVLVRNMSNGEADVGGVRDFRSLYGLSDPVPGFRVPIPCDKGDELIIEIYDGSTGEEKWSKRFMATARGFGHRRQSPDMRRLLGLAQMVLDASDPVNYAPHYFIDPLEDVGPSNVLVIHTLGDMKVPAATGVTLARAAGIVDYDERHPEYHNKSLNQVLIDGWVLEGIARTDRFPGHNCAYFDPDDLGEGQDDDCSLGTYPNEDCETHVFNAAHLGDFYLGAPPLRHKTRVETDAGVSSLRLPNAMIWDDALGAEDRHGFFTPSPTKPFNVDLYLINLIGRYFQTGGKVLMGSAGETEDHRCLEEHTDCSPCSFWSE